MVVSNTSAQRFAGEYAWKTILEYEGVIFRYIYYRAADTQDDGIVVMLENTNEHAVQYRFTIIFRSEETKAEALAEGELDPGEIKTGDADGLFWIPFDDGRALSAVGVRSYRIMKVEVVDKEISHHPGLICFRLNSTATEIFCYGVVGIEGVI